MIKSKSLKSVVSIVLALVFVISSPFAALACTSLYLGRDTTEHGTTIWGRNEDIWHLYSKLFTVVPAQSHEPGTYYESSTGFKWPYPAETLRYTVTPDSIYNEGVTPQPYGAVGMNEKNVSITATTSLSPAHLGIRTADPFISVKNGGLAEVDLPTPVLMQATSARDAVELLAEIIDTVGNAERNGIMISDPNELWYMETLAGHQYVAVKAPSDKIAFSPNITMMGAVDVTDTENVIASEGLIETAREAGTLVEDANGHIIVAESYAVQRYNARLYQGYKYLIGEDAANSLDPAGYYEYFIDPRPEGKYTLYEAMRFMACPAIGHRNTVQSHMFETRHDMPEDLATVLWLAMGPAEFSIFLPSYGNLITETFENYTAYDSPRTNPDYNSMYWLFHDIFTLSSGDRNNVAPGVAEFLELYQKSLIEQQRVIDEKIAAIYAKDPELAQQAATELHLAIAEQAFEIMTLLRNEIMDYNQDPDPDKGVYTPSVKLPSITVESRNINLNSNGIVTVTLRSSDDFDAAAVDPETVYFAGAAPVRWQVRGNGDVHFQFKTQELEISCTKFRATLNGETVDGEAFWATELLDVLSPMRQVSQRSR